MTTAFYTAIKDDYLLFDNVELVTLTLPSVAQGTVSNVACLFEPMPIRRGGGGSGGGGEFDVSGDGGIAILFASTLAGHEPELGSTITFSNGEAWSVVKQPMLMSARARYRCSIVKERA